MLLMSLNPPGDEYYEEASCGNLLIRTFIEKRTTQNQNHYHF